MSPSSKRAIKKRVTHPQRNNRVGLNFQLCERLVIMTGKEDAIIDEQNLVKGGHLKVVHNLEG